MKKRSSPAKLHHQREHPLLGIRADPDVAREILGRRMFHPRGVAEVLVTVVDSLEPFADPSGHRLDRADAQTREALEHPVVHHRGQRDARVLHVHHRDVHEAGIAGAVPLAAGVVGMADEMDADGEVEFLRRGPDWIEVRVAEAAPANRRGADEDGAASKPGHARHLARGQRGVAHRDMRGRKQSILVSGHQFEGPGVVRAAERIGELRVVDRAFPQKSHRGVEHLRGEAFLVEVADAQVHVLPLLARDTVKIEVADAAAFLLLPISGAGAHQFIEVGHPHRPVVDDEAGDAAARIDADADRAIAVGGVGIALEQIEGLDKVAVSVNHSHIAHAPWSSVIPIARLESPLKRGSQVGSPNCLHRHGRCVGRADIPDVTASRAKHIKPCSLSIR